jgi:hypothetical protein
MTSTKDKKKYISVLTDERDWKAHIKEDILLYTLKRMNDELSAKLELVSGEREERKFTNFSERFESEASKTTSAIQIKKTDRIINKCLKDLDNHMEVFSTIKLVSPTCALLLL